MKRSFSILLTLALVFGISCLSLCPTSSWAAPANRLVRTPNIKITFANDKVEHITGTRRNYGNQVRTTLTAQFHAVKRGGYSFKYHGITSVWMQVEGYPRVTQKLKNKGTTETRTFRNIGLLKLNSLRLFCLRNKNGGIYRIPIQLGISSKSSVLFNGKRRYITDLNQTKIRLPVLMTCQAAAVRPLIKVIKLYELSCPAGYKFNKGTARKMVVKFIRRGLTCVKK